MADFDAQLPVRTIATEFTTEIANAAGTTINPVEEFAQGSTTAAQKGPLEQGAVTTAAPAYTNGQTSPLSLTTSGSLRIDGSGSTQPVSGTITANQGTSPWVTNESQIAGTTVSVNTGNADSGTQRVVLATNQPAIPVTVSGDSVIELPQYNTAASIAAGASNTQTYSPASTVSLDGVDASASGQMKVEIQYGTTGAETTKAVFFTSKGNLQLQWRLPNPVSITNTMSVKVIRTNTDNQAMDVYSTVQIH